jgi:hypothetical protein
MARNDRDIRMIDIEPTISSLEELNQVAQRCY